MFRKFLITAAFAASSLLAAGTAWADITILVPSGSEGDGFRAAAADYATMKGSKVEIVQAPYSQRFRAGRQCRSDQIRRLRHRPDGRSMDSVLCRERPSRRPDDLLHRPGRPRPDNDFLAKSLAVCRNLTIPAPSSVSPMSAMRRCSSMTAPSSPSRRTGDPKTWDE